MKIIRNVLLSVLALAALTQCNSQNTKTNMSQNNATDTITKQIIVDVRTVEEWNYDGHAPCSVNIPLDQLEGKVDSLRAYDKVVLVCRSGGRASSAKRFLEESGFRNVENLGAWQNIECAK